MAVSPGDEVPIGDSEAEGFRLAALERYQILDTAAEETFDRITRLAADLFQVPIALISLVDQDRQWFKSRVGLDAIQTSRETTFCAHAVQSGAVCMVPNALEDERFARNPLVLGEPKIRFYAGAPLVTSDGFRLGTLCIIDRVPRPVLTGEQQKTLQDLSAMVVQELECRRTLELQRDAEMRLIESENTFRSAMEHSPVGMALASLQFNWTQSNHALEKFLGYSGDELRVLNYKEITHPSDLPRNMELTEALLEGRVASFRMEKRLRRKDGVFAWAEVAVSLVRDSTGKPKYFVSQVLDIGERKRAEAKLRESEQRFRGSFETAAHGMALVSPEGHWLKVNRSLCTMLGYSEDELLATKFQAITHPDDLNSDLDNVSSVLSGDINSYAMEKRYFRKDRSIVWILLSVSLVRDDDGVPLHFVAHIKDIHERKLAAARIQRLIERNDLATEAGQVGIWEWCIESQELIWDSRMFKLYRFDESASPCDYRKWENALHPDDRDAATGLLQKAMAGEEAFDTEFRIQWPNRETRNIRAKATVVRDQLGKAVRMVGTNWDVTEIRSLARQLEEEKNTAERANQAKSEFLTTMSHELRTPMNGILGFSQLLEIEKFGTLNAKQKEFVAAVLGSGNHLLRLIDDVLELSKIESGKLTVTRESVDVLPVCKSVFASLTQLAGSYGIHLEFGDSGIGLPPVLADRTRLAQCLLNMGSNAIKYNRPDGKVTFTYQLIRADLVRISVVDTGIGIPIERQNELFQPFNRLGAEQKAIEGTGVGLALTQRLAHLMGGSIGFKSAANEGSTFWIDLPRYRMVDNVEGVHEHDTRPTTTNKNIGCKLLYVEDNAMNRSLISNICAALGSVTLIEAVDGNSGLEAARRERPDVILLDINLPDQNGFALLQQLKRDPTFASTPILALSANAMPSDIKRGLAAGFYRYLSKPIVVFTLLEAIDQALEASKFISQHAVSAVRA